MADENDGLLNPDETAAPLNSAGTGTPPASGEPSQESESQAGDSGQTSQDSSPVRNTSSNLLDPSKLESLLEQHNTGQPIDTSEDAPAPNATEKLLDQAEADLAAAISPNLDSQPGSAAELGSAESFHFQSFDKSAADNGDGVGLNALEDVELHLRIELGRAELLIEEVLELKEGSVVPLDKLAGDPVDILVNGKLIARGEVLVLNNNFCVRVAEILTPDF